MNAVLNSKKIDKKQRIIDSAYRLFKTNGFYATGVDLIMREAGVSKRTLYNYFPGKNDLIVAVLQHYRNAYQNHLDNLLAGQDTPHRAIRAIFEDAQTWFCDVNFHGCLAVNAMGEFSGKDTAIEQACVAFKTWELGVLAGLTAQLEVESPQELAYKLYVLLEGMAAIAQVSKGRFPVNMLAMAEELIARHRLLASD